MKIVHLILKQLKQLQKFEFHYYPFLLILVIIYSLQFGTEKLTWRTLLL